MIRFRVNSDSVKMTVEPAVAVNSSGQVYEGSYEIIPSAKEQTLNTKNRFMTQDVKIAPIPNNYGLITYHQDRTITIT